MFGIVPEKFKKSESDIISDMNCEHDARENLTTSHQNLHNHTKENELYFGSKVEDKDVLNKIKLFVMGSENRSCQDRLVITMDSPIY